MLNNKSISIMVVIVLLFLTTMPLQAVENKKEDSFENKIKADSPFYFLDKWGENIKLFFANKENKTKLKFMQSYERLVEAKEMLDTDKKEEAKVLFKEGMGDFKIALRLAKNNLIESKEVKGLENRLTDIIREIQVLLYENQLFLEDVKNRIDSVFD